MARSTHSVSARSGRRDRHGRGIRSAVTGPVLEPIRTRIGFFDSCVASAIAYVRDEWPDELANVHFEVAGVPSGEPGPAGVDRWRVSPRERRIVLYRLPIERLAHLHKDD